jgi:hypothetical protein
MFLIGYTVVSICEIFTVGAFPLDATVRKVCRGRFHGRIRPLIRL